MKTIKELKYRIYTWLFKPVKPRLRITQHSDTNWWLQKSNENFGHWATPKEIEELTNLYDPKPSKL